MEFNSQSVGRIVKVVHDFNRSEIYNQEDHRSFPVSIYYPSVTASQDAPVSNVLSLFYPAHNEAKATFADLGIDEETLKSVETPVVDNAIPQLGRKLPVVIFSPGFGIDRDLYVEVIANVLLD